MERQADSAATQRAVGWRADSLARSSNTRGCVHRTRNSIHSRKWGFFLCLAFLAGGGAGCDEAAAVDRGGEATIRVVDAETGRPIEGAYVRVVGRGSRLGGFGEGRRSRDIFFALERTNASGEFALTAQQTSVERLLMSVWASRHEAVGIIISYSVEWKPNRSGSPLEPGRVRPARYYTTYLLNDELDPNSYNTLHARMDPGPYPTEIRLRRVDHRLDTWAATVRRAASFTTEGCPQDLLAATAEYARQERELLYQAGWREPSR